MNHDNYFIVDMPLVKANSPAIKRADPPVGGEVAGLQGIFVIVQDQLK